MSLCLHSYSKTYSLSIVPDPSEDCYSCDKQWDQLSHLLLVLFTLSCCPLSSSLHQRSNAGILMASRSPLTTFPVPIPPSVPSHLAVVTSSTVQAPTASPMGSAGAICAYHVGRVLMKAGSQMRVPSIVWLRPDDVITISLPHLYKSIGYRYHQPSFSNIFPLLRDK